MKHQSGRFHDAKLLDCLYDLSAYVSDLFSQVLLQLKEPTVPKMNIVNHNYKLTRHFATTLRKICQSCIENKMNVAKMG